MAECQHELAERETACADGQCPICQSTDLRNLRAENAALKAARHAELSYVEAAARMEYDGDRTDVYGTRDKLISLRAWARNRRGADVVKEAAALAAGEGKE